MQPQPSPGGLAAPVEFRALAQRPLFPVAAYLMLGIFAGAWWGIPRGWAALAFLAAALLCAVLAAFRVGIKLPAAVAAFLAGVALVSAAIPAWAGDQWMPDGPVRVSGTIEDAGLSLTGKAKYTIDRVTIDGKAVDGAVQVIVDSGSPQGKAGDTLSFQGGLERPMPSRFYGDFNARGYYLRQGVRFTAFAGEVRVLPAAQEGGLLALPAMARGYAQGVLYRYLSHDSAALVDALLSGERSGIPADIRTAFSLLGVAHLLAVSGLNISLTAGAAWLLCRKLRVPLPISCAVAIAVLVAYALFAGMTPSVERAAAMWLVMIGAQMAARRYDPLSSISAAAIVLLALSPLDLFDAGFQLSFAATAAIFLWTEPLVRLLPETKWLKGLAGSVGVTVCVLIMALPMMLWYFGFISATSPLANLILVPTSFIMQLAGTALVLTGFAPGIASVIGMALDWYTTLYLSLVKVLTGTAVALHAAMPAPWFIAGYAALVLLVSPTVFRLSRAVRRGAVAMVALCAVVMMTPLPGLLARQPDAVVLYESSSTVSVTWQQDGRRYAACSGEWGAAAAYLCAQGAAAVDGLYLLNAKPPKNTAVLLAETKVAKLYVPRRWLADETAAPLLAEAAKQHIPVLAAEDSLAGYQENDGKAGVLTIPAGGRYIAYVPFASGKALDALRPELAQADAVAACLSSKRAAALVGVAPVLLAADAVAAEGAAGYNLKRCGSVAVTADASGLQFAPWAGKESDGIQGSFR